MGLGDPEDAIPALFIVFAILGFIGGLVTYVPAINSIPVLNSICPLIHSAFVMLANFMTPYIPLEATLIALLLEVLIIIISIVIIVKVGY